MCLKLTTFYIRLCRLQNNNMVRRSSFMSTLSYQIIRSYLKTACKLFIGLGEVRTVAD